MFFSDGAALPAFAAGPGAIDCSRRVPQSAQCAAPTLSTEAVKTVDAPNAVAPARAKGVVTDLHAWPPVVRPDPAGILFLQLDLQPQTVEAHRCDSIRARLGARPTAFATIGVRKRDVVEANKTLPTMANAREKTIFRISNIRKARARVAALTSS